MPNEPRFCLRGANQALPIAQVQYSITIIPSHTKKLAPSSTKDSLLFIKEAKKCFLPYVDIMRIGEDLGSDIDVFIPEDEYAQRRFFRDTYARVF